MDLEKIELWSMYQPQIVSYMKCLDEVKKQRLYEQLELYPPEVWTPLFNQTFFDTSKGFNQYQPPLNLDHFPKSTSNLSGAAVLSIENIDLNYVQNLWSQGVDFIGHGKVAILIMAGGQSSRFESTKYKGFWNIGPHSGKSLFQIFIEKLIRLHNIYMENHKDFTPTKPQSPIFIMVSEHNRSTISDFLNNNHYFGYPSENVRLFNQEMAPTFDQNGNYMLAGPNELLLNPNGNGSCFYALKNNSIIQEISQKGVEFLHAFSMDNLLTQVADPIAISIMNALNLEVLNKCIHKESGDSNVGLFCNKVDDDKNLLACVAEYSEVTDSFKQLSDNKGKHVYSSGNICNHFFSTSFLSRVSMSNEFIYHKASKQTQSFNLSDKTYSQATSCYKLEKFIFDYFAFTKLVLGLEEPKSTCFAPIKRVEGKDSIQSAIKSMSDLHLTWLKNNKLVSNFCTPGDGFIEISPLVSYCGENLKKIETLDVFKKDNGYYIHY